MEYYFEEILVIRIRGFYFCGNYYCLREDLFLVIMLVLFKNGVFEFVLVFDKLIFVEKD